MEIVTLLVLDDTSDTDPDVLVGISVHDCMRQFREAYADFIDDWKWMSDTDLLERCLHHGIRTQMLTHVVPTHQ